MSVRKSAAQTIEHDEEFSPLRRPVAGSELLAGDGELAAEALAVYDKDRVVTPMDHRGKRYMLKLYSPESRLGADFKQYLDTELGVFYAVDARVVAGGERDVDGLLKLRRVVLAGERARLLVTQRYRGTLLDYMDAHRVRDAATVLHVYSLIWRALCQLHALGFLHRDVKPENVFCDWSDDGRVTELVLGDYGNAGPRHLKLMNNLGASGYYTPPEVAYAATRRYGVEFDHYALGLVLFELAAHDAVARHPGVARDTRVYQNGTAPELVDYRLADAAYEACVVRWGRARSPPCDDVDALARLFADLSPAGPLADAVRESMDRSREVYARWKRRVDAHQTLASKATTAERMAALLRINDVVVALDLAREFGAFQALFSCLAGRSRAGLMRRPEEDRIRDFSAMLGQVAHHLAEPHTPLPSVRAPAAATPKRTRRTRGKSG